MKKLQLLLLLAVIGCTSVKKVAGPIRLTVTRVVRTDSLSDVWAKRSYMLYMAQILNLHDSVKKGTVIYALPYNKKDTTCKCAFKRIR